eukprot:1138386-Pelagomonas_calceolata.AAC.7
MHEAEIAQGRLWRGANKALPPRQNMQDPYPPSAILAFWQTVSLLHHLPKSSAKPAVQTVYTCAQASLTRLT